MILRRPACYSEGQEWPGIPYKINRYLPVSKLKVLWQKI